MSKLLANIKDSKDTFELQFLPDGYALINGKKLPVEHKFLSKECLLVRLDNKNFMFNLISAEDNLFRLQSGSENFDISCKTKLDLLKESVTGKGGKKKQLDRIISPMPGAVVKVNVKEGDTIQGGDVLLVLEAMKMENEIKASHSCSVKKILVKEKQSVDKGQLLIELS